VWAPFSPLKKKNLAGHFRTPEPQCKDHPIIRVVLIGPPAAGKGTAAERLKSEYCLCHLSTGEMLREEIRKETKEGLLIEHYVSKGILVPDRIIIDLIRQKISDGACAKGMILDGFPRTLPQAVVLDQILAEDNEELTHVIEFKIDFDLLIERASGRRIHPASGRTYHVKFNPPKVPDVDDITGEPLIKRKDDDENILRERLNSYSKETKPILKFYKTQGILNTVDSSHSIDETWRSVADIIENN